MELILSRPGIGATPLQRALASPHLLAGASLFVTLALFGLYSMTSSRPERSSDVALDWGGPGRPIDARPQAEPAERRPQWPSALPEMAQKPASVPQKPAAPTQEPGKKDAPGAPVGPVADAVASPPLKASGLGPFGFAPSAGAVSRGLPGPSTSALPERADAPARGSKNPPARAFASALSAGRPAAKPVGGSSPGIARGLAPRPAAGPGGFVSGGPLAPAYDAAAPSIAPGPGSSPIGAGAGVGGADGAKGLIGGTDPGTGAMGGGGGGGGDGAGAGGVKNPLSPMQVDKRAQDALAVANFYKAKVVDPLVKKERKEGKALRAKIGASLKTLAALSAQVQAARGSCGGTQEADAALNAASQGLDGGTMPGTDGTGVMDQGLRARLSEASALVADGLGKIGLVPKQCHFAVRTGKKGRGPAVDVHGVAVSGQKELAQGLSRTVHAGEEAQILVNGPVDQAFGPAIGSFQASGNAVCANKLYQLDSQLKTGLGEVAALLPRDMPAPSPVKGHGRARKQTALMKSSRQGFAKIWKLDYQFRAENLRYQPTNDRRLLRENLADAVDTSGRNVTLLESRTDQGQPVLGSLVDAGQQATTAHADVCDSYHELKALKPAAK